MVLKKLSVATLIFATVSSSVSFAQDSSANDSSVEYVDVSLDASDLAAEAEMDAFVDVLDSMPEDLQQLPMNHADVVNYLNERLAFDSAGLDRGSWLSWGCGKALAVVAVTTGFPAGKIATTLKAAKKIAGSWKGVALMVKTHRWGALGGEAVKILAGLTGIDKIIQECT